VEKWQDSVDQGKAVMKGREMGLAGSICAVLCSSAMGVLAEQTPGKSVIVGRIVAMEDSEGLGRSVRGLDIGVAQGVVIEVEEVLLGDASPGPIIVLLRIEAEVTGTKWLGGSVGVLDQEYWKPGMRVIGVTEEFPDNQAWCRPGILTWSEPGVGGSDSTRTWIYEDPALRPFAGLRTACSSNTLMFALRD
jgi:hypothetical protein